MAPDELAALARRQQADYVVAQANLPIESSGPLERVHQDGRYALYRLLPPAGLADRLARDAMPRR